METERITLSQRERDRLKVLHEVEEKQCCFSRFVVRRLATGVWAFACSEGLVEMLVVTEERRKVSVKNRSSHRVRAYICPSVRSHKQGR
jgi:hypothetical protein